MESPIEIIDVEDISDNDNELIEDCYNDRHSKLLNQIHKARLAGEWIDVIEICIELGDIYTQAHDYEKANETYRQALDLSKHCDDRDRYGKACYKLAKGLATTNDNDSSILLFINYLNIFSKEENHKNTYICEALHSISVLYALIGENNLSRDYYKAYKKLADNDTRFLPDLNLRNFTFNRLPTISSILPHPADIIDNDNKSSSLNTDPEFIINNLSRLWYDSNYKGIKLYHMKKYQKAAELFFSQLNKHQYCELLPFANKLWKLNSMEKLGACFRELKEYDNAIRCFQIKMKIEENIPLGILHQNCKALSQLEICYRRMYEKLKNMDLPSDLSISKKLSALNIAEYYKKKGLEIKTKYEEQSRTPHCHVLAEYCYFSGNLNDAIKLYRLILQHDQLTVNELEKFIMQCNLGHALFAANLMDDAIIAYQVANMMNVNLKQQDNQTIISYNLYQIYRNRNYFIFAEIELNTYLELISEMNDHFGECLGYESMMDLLKETKNYKKALKFAIKYLECAKILGDKKGIICAEKNIDKLNKLLRNFSQAGPSQPQQSKDIFNIIDYQEILDKHIDLE